MSSNGLAFTLPERDYTSSYAQHFVFSVERQLRNDYLVSLAGVSTRGLHLARFAVMEDSIAGGQIAEFGYCKDDRHILALLRQRGKHSTWMINDAHLVDAPYIRVFEYDETNLDVTLREATAWAEAFLERRAATYDKHYPWRLPPRRRSEES